MNKKEIISASEYDEGEVLLLVDVDYADSLYHHLKSIGVVCQSPTGAIFRPRVYADEKGRKQTEHEPLVKAIVVDGTLKDFDNWIKDWAIPMV
jgi:hypothetical protein